MVIAQNPDNDTSRIRNVYLFGQRNVSTSAKINLRTPEYHVAIILAHNGPTGLGSQAEDIWAKENCQGNSWRGADKSANGVRACFFLNWFLKRRLSPFLFSSNVKRQKNILKSLISTNNTCSYLNLPRPRTSWKSSFSRCMFVISISSKAISIDWSC